MHIRCLTSNDPCLAAGTWPLMWACAHVGTVLVTFSHRECSDSHCTRLARHPLFKGVQPLFGVCPEAGKGMRNVTLLLAWLGKIYDVIWDSRCESQSGRCDSPAFWIWQLATQGAYNQTCFLLKCSCYGLGWRKGSRSRGNRSRSTVFFGFFYSEKTSLEVYLQKTFVFLSFLSLLD